MDQDQGAGLPPAHEAGSPVGRRVVLGLLGVAGVGVLLGNRVSSLVNVIAEADPTGLTNYLPGNGRFRFYSVVSRVVPQQAADYRLRVEGDVTRPMDLTLADLAALPQTTMTKDVQCVTGWRVDDVVWSGVLLADLLDLVGAQPGPGAVLFGSFDGKYTESLTMAQARRRDVLIATRLNGEPVSHDHGGPARLYVAPMYFYKSLKWLDRITVTDAVVPGYWEERGYDIDAWVGQSNGRDDDPVG